MIAALPPALFGLGFSPALMVAAGSSNRVVGGPTSYPWVPSAACPRGTNLAVGAPVLLLLGWALVDARKRLPLESHLDRWCDSGCGSWDGWRHGALVGMGMSSALGVATYV